MRNIVTKVEGDILHIAIDLKQTQGRTKGGKGDVIAATGGFQKLPDNHRYAFNFMLYKKDEKVA